MIKAINAGIGKAKPFIKKTAMATMFATSVIAGNANAKNVQKSEPITNQTEVVSKSGAEALTNLAQVQNNINKQRIISTKHNEKLDKKLINLYSDTKDFDIKSTLDDWYADHGTFVTSYLAQGLLNKNSVYIAYNEIPETAKPEYQAKMADLVELFDMHQSSLDEMILDPINDLGATPAVGTAERCNRYIDNAMISNDFTTFRKDDYDEACETFEYDLKGDDAVMNQSDLITYKTFLIDLYAIQEIATKLELHEEDEFYDFITSFIKNSDPRANK